MADGHDGDLPGAAVDAIDDAEATNAILDQASKFEPQRIAPSGIQADRSERVPHAPLDVRREVTNAFCDIGRGRDSVDSHYRARFLGRTCGSPNTCSNETPLPPLAK